MPISAPGNRGAVRLRVRRRRAAGFTLIELLIVVVLVALASAVVSLALRDPAETRLAEEGERLAALLESARAEARASGLPLRWVPGAAGEGADFRFIGLPASVALPDKWLDPRVSAEVVGARAVTLGPEALIGAQRIVLRLDDRRLELATDGLGPFAVPSSPAGAGG